MRTIKEIWKPIPGFEGYYEASNLGRIRSINEINVFVRKDGKEIRRKHNCKILKPIFDGKKFYLQVSLSKNGVSKRYLIHRLIAKTFIDNPLNLPEVNHKDEDKTNNCVSNLEWCDHKYNNNYGSKKTSSNGENNSMNKFPEEVIREVKKLYIPKDKEFGATALSKKYNMSITHIVAIAKGRKWGWL